MSAIEELEARARKFTDWFDSLTSLDQQNFKALINLPNAETIVSRMHGAGNHGQYVEMAIFALASMDLLEALGQEE